MTQIVLLGAGGHARVLLKVLARLGHSVLGVVAAQTPERDIGVPLLGDDAWLLDRGCQGIVLVNGIGSVGETGLRSKVSRRFRDAGFTFQAVVDPLASIEDDCRIGDGAQILRGGLIQTGVQVGADAIVNTGAIIDHDCRIGAGAHIAPGCVLSGEVIVGERAHLGTGSVVRQGIHIGSGAVIGAGSVVVSNIADGMMACGVPARVVKR